MLSEADVLFWPETFDRSDEAAEDAAALVREDVSRLASEAREFSTLVELSLFTRFLEPEMRPPRKLVLSCLVERPFMFCASDRRVWMLVGLEKSSLPALLYWE